jgi:dolichyl-phosphate beta-glucosyltransferase
MTGRGVAEPGRGERKSGLQNVTTTAAPAISVVVPCFNESERLPENLPRLVAFLEASRRTYELLVVDDGSTDDTAEVARRLGGSSCRVLVQAANRGKGAAVRAGVLASRAPLVLYTDADLSTPMVELERLEDALRAGAEIAIGSRALRESKVEVHQPWWRERLGRLFNRVIRILGVSGLRDTQCGFKLFRGEPGRAIFSQVVVERWAFDVEALLVARLLGYRIAEVPVTWRNSTDTKVSVLRDLTRTLLDLLRIRLRWLGRRPQRPAP